MEAACWPVPVVRLFCTHSSNELQSLGMLRPFEQFDEFRSHLATASSPEFCAARAVFVYLLASLCTRWPHCVPAGHITYPMVSLCTCWPRYIPDGLIMYPLVVLYTCWSHYTPAGLIVYLLASLCTRWPHVIYYQPLQVCSFNNTKLNKFFPFIPRGVLNSQFGVRRSLR